MAVDDLPLAILAAIDMGDPQGKVCRASSDPRTLTYTRACRRSGEVSTPVSVTKPKLVASSSTTRTGPSQGPGMRTVNSSPTRNVPDSMRPPMMRRSVRWRSRS